MALIGAARNHLDRAQASQFSAEEYVGLLVEAGRRRSAMYEVNNHFMADSGNVNNSPLFAGPGTANPNPARGVGLVLTVTFPMKLYLYRAIVIRKDLVADRADHNNRRPDRLRRWRDWPETYLRGKASEGVLVDKRRVERCGGMARTVRGYRQ